LMPRVQREKSKSGYYHVMLRGNERKNIFRDDEDKLRFIETLSEKKQENRYSLHAFCLMDNHIHLMVSEGAEDVADVIKRISISYVYYFNRKYKRVGHLFQDRFKSEAVEDDRYILTLARYIHRNPVKAGLVRSVSEYKWSSYDCYVNEHNQFAKIIDTNTVLGLLSNDVVIAQQRFREYMNEEEQEEFIDLVEEDEGAVERKARELITSIQSVQSLADADGNAKKQIGDLIKKLREETNLSIRKISEITGLGRDKVHRIIKR